MKNIPIRYSSLYEGCNICSAVSTPFFRSLENLYSFDPYILTKMRKKMSYFDPYFSSKLGKMYSFTPPPPPPPPPFFFNPCSVSSRRAVLSIHIQNLTEYTPPPRDLIYYKLLHILDRVPHSARSIVNLAQNPGVTDSIINYILCSETRLSSGWSTCLF